MQEATLKGPRSHESAEPRECILVVEDNPGLGRALSLVIRRFGCDPTVVGTAAEAIEQLADLHAWGGIILDLCLADGPGLPVLEQVRKRDRDISVLIHTAHSEHAAISAAFDLGAHFLEKPSKPDQIERFLRVAEVSAGHRRVRMLAHAGSEAFPDDLRELVGEVLSAVIEVGTKEAEYAYRLALLARAASGRRLCGRSATEACAEAVQVSRQTLQAYATVAARWEPGELQALLERRDCEGRPLTISHLLLIARTPQASRNELVERVLREGFDVRQLLPFVAEGRRETPPGTPRARGRRKSH